MLKTVLLFAFLFLVLIGVFYYFNSQNNDIDLSEATITSKKTERQNVYIDNHIQLIVDPTIFEYNEEDKYQGILDELEKTLKRLPPKLRISVWPVKNRIDQQSYLYDGSFELDVFAQVDTAHEKNLNMMCTDIRKKLTQSWRMAHADSTYLKPSSCIMNTIRIIAKLPRENENTKTYLIVISDFMESCTGWPFINIDISNNFQDTTKYIKDLHLVNLSNFSKVMFIKLHDNRTLDPSSENGIELYWRSVALRMHVDINNFTYLSTIPVRFL